MSSSPSAAPGENAAGPNHAVRFTVLWVVGTVIAVPIVIFVIGPLLGPGNGSEQVERPGHRLHGAGRDGTPVLTLVMLFLLYSVIFFRQPKGAALEGPAVRGDARIQTTWIIITSALVLGSPSTGPCG